MKKFFLLGLISVNNISISNNIIIIMKKFFLLGLISVNNISISNNILPNNNFIMDTLSLSTNHYQVFTLNGLQGILFNTGIITGYYFFVTPLLNSQSLGGFLLNKYYPINGKLTKEASIYLINNYALYPMLSFLHNGYYDSFILGCLLSNTNSDEMKQIYLTSLQLNGIHGICILTYSGIVVYFFNSETSYITTMIVKYGIAGLGGFIQWYIMKNIYKNSFLNILEFACGIHAKYIEGIPFVDYAYIITLLQKSPQEILETVLQYFNTLKELQSKSPYFKYVFFVEKIVMTLTIYKATQYIANSFSNPQKYLERPRPNNNSNNNIIQYDNNILLNA